MLLNRNIHNKRITWGKHRKLSNQIQVTLYKPNWGNCTRTVGCSKYKKNQHSFILLVKVAFAAVWAHKCHSPVRSLNLYLLTELAAAGCNFFPESFGKNQTVSNSVTVPHCQTKPPVMPCSVMITSILEAKLAFVLSAVPTHLSCKVIPLGLS